MGFLQLPLPTSPPIASLGKPLRHSRVEMVNLIGAEVDGYAKSLKVPGASVHLYGKGDGRPGRKMGHVTRIFAD